MPEIGLNEVESRCVGGSWRRNGLELVGKGASDGGSVGIDFRDCALYPDYIIETSIFCREITALGWVFVRRRHVLRFGL
jgi:hypothetical protein